MYIEETGVHCAMCACMAALYSAPQNFASQKTNENVKPEAKTATMGKKQNLVISDKIYIKSYNFFRFEFRGTLRQIVEFVQLLCIKNWEQVCKVDVRHILASWWPHHGNQALAAESWLTYCTYPWHYKLCL